MNTRDDQATPAETPPWADYLWDGIGLPDRDVRRLERTLGVLRHQGPPPAPARRWSAVLPSLLATAALIAVAVVAWQVLVEPPGWHLTPTGVVTIGGRAVSEDDRLAIGARLETGSDAEAVLEVPDLGMVMVRPHSRVRIVASRAEHEHRIRLERGHIDVVVEARPRQFLVETPHALVVDLGCAYTLDVDGGGNGHVVVTDGLVAVETASACSVVPEGARCRIDSRYGPGTPHAADASGAMRQAIDHFDARQGEDIALTIILRHARPADLLTLWHVLERVEPDARRDVADRMTSLVDLPDGVTASALAALDPTALDEVRRLFESQK